MTAQRAYQKTHAFINFEFDFNKIDAKSWLQLGQLQAKCDQISGVPLLPSVASNLHRIFLAKGVLATTAIEGNTLTEDEVLRLMEGKLTLPPSKEYLAQEIENILDAVNGIAPAFLISRAPLALSPEEIRTYNRMILRALPLPEEVTPGEYRTHDVRVATYKGAPPDDIPFLVDKLCDWLNSWKMPEYLSVAAGILKAIVAHVYIAWIHPFADGNGRTARLIELRNLLTVGFPTPVTHLLSNHYNQTRSEYYRYLDMTSKREDGIYQFIAYALQGFLDNLDEQIKFIEAQQLAVHWRDYVYAQFRNRDGQADTRRRRLILELSSKTEPLSVQQIRHLSPRIAEAYAGKSDITIRRDIKELEKMELIRATPEGIKANEEVIRAFLPQKRS